IRYLGEVDASPESIDRWPATLTPQRSRGSKTPIPFHRVGNRVRYARADAESWALSMFGERHLTTADYKTREEEEPGRALYRLPPDPATAARQAAALWRFFRARSVGLAIGRLQAPESQRGRKTNPLYCPPDALRPTHPRSRVR